MPALRREHNGAGPQSLVQRPEQSRQHLVGNVLEKEAGQGTVPDAIGLPLPKIDNLELDLGGATSKASAGDRQDIGHGVERAEPVQPGQ